MCDKNWSALEVIDVIYDLASNWPLYLSIMIHDGDSGLLVAVEDSLVQLKSNLVLDSLSSLQDNLF